MFNFKNELENHGWVWTDVDEGAVEIKTLIPEINKYIVFQLDAESPISDFCFQVESFNAPFYIVDELKMTDITVNQIKHYSALILQTLRIIYDICICSDENCKEYIKIDNPIERNYSYNIVGNIGELMIKWHPIYKYSLWKEDRCLYEASSLTHIIEEIYCSYKWAINNKEMNEIDT